MITVEGLTKYYRNLCAVDHIGFEVQLGEIVGLLGPNGAGKTTTLRMLTGFMKPSEGRIQIKNFDIGANTRDIKKLMGYLPESAPIYGDMLVYDYLRYIAGIRKIKSGETLGRLKKMVHVCGLSSVMHKPVSELSKGYKQRVGLAHAMLDDPEILILDEPTSGLDPNQIVEIREIIKEIGKEKTVILSTHILSEAEATCDRVIIINNGQIIADGDLQTIQQRASGKQTLHMTIKGADPQSIRSLMNEVTTTGNIRIDNRNDALAVTLTNHADGDLRESIYRRIKSTDWMLLEFYQETKSLENTFRELTMEN